MKMKFEYKVIELANETDIIQSILDIWGANGYKLASTITEIGKVKLILVKETE